MKGLEINEADEAGDDATAAGGCKTPPQQPLKRPLEFHKIIIIIVYIA